MNLLAIDTSTEACSASLAIGIDIRTRFEVAPRRHAELLLPMIRELLSEAEINLNQLDSLAFGRGPGAFTGIRIATGVIQGLAYSADLPVIPVSSLAALAQSVAKQHDYIFPAFDARMEEIYYAPYYRDQRGLVHPLSKEEVSPPSKINLQEKTRSWFGIGTGWESWHTVLQPLFGRNFKGFKDTAYPSAEYIIPLAKDRFSQGLAVTAEAALPVYLRNKITSSPNRR